MKHFYTNMPRSDLIDWLRYSAIAGGMPQQFLDHVDALDDFADLEAQVVELEEKLSQAEKDRDHLFEELQDLVKAVTDCDPELTSENITAALKWANKALERHGGSA